MSINYYTLELEQDAYGSAVIPLPDELCHDLAIQPNERFEVEVEDGTITLKRLFAGYDIEE
jgi:antitoxin component of MazEF toxin-antitoxin module|tara:strand:+ start:965 stop:1147 length:183 start_codon:yes stop_codon:yes gene_type:complete